jgi:hypothetical protein
MKLCQGTRLVCWLNVQASIVLMLRLLADDLNKTRRSVTWTASLDRVDVNNAKVRKRHLELVVARAIRARDRELAANRARGRE